MALRGGPGPDRHRGRGAPLTGWTRDTPTPDVAVWQPARGFRYGSEAFWLVGFALEGGRPATALDLGTGSGIAALLLARQGVTSTGIDLRREWREGWARTLDEQELPVELHTSDVRAWRGPRVDVVVSNPPYFATERGPRSADAWKAAARTEGEARLADFVATAIAHGRRACFVVPEERGVEVVGLARAASWVARRWVRVGRRRALVELAPDASGCDAPRLADDAELTSWVERARASR